MAITLIRSLDGFHQDADPLPVQLADWHRRAGRAGRTIAIRQCRDEEEAVRAVRDAEAQQAELIVVDPGDAAPDGRLSSALAAATVPYVELHRDDFRHLVPPLRPGPRRIGLVQGYGSRGLDLAFWIAFDALCLDAANDDYHVGT